MPNVASAIEGSSKRRTRTTCFRALRSTGTISLTALTVVALRDGAPGWRAFAEGAGRYWPVFTVVFGCLLIWEYVRGQRPL